MSQLAQLQHRFQAYVMEDQNGQAPAWVSATGRADPALQISVYTHAYRSRLQEALAEDYPAVNAAIGDDAFSELLDAYIQHFPSRYFSLREFGQDFSGFLAQHPIQHEQPWLAELAAFEWTLRSAFDAADAPRLTEQELATIAPTDWPSLRFVAHPSLRFSHVNWNIAAIWKCMVAEPPEEITAEAAPACVWLIWRDEEMITRYCSLEQDEERALACLCAGGDFDEVCQTLTAFHDEADVPLRAAGLLKNWIGQGLLSELLS
ncbi:MAG: DNA-binding domain-containing protein [Gammaproteobacteria bacterium]